MITYVTLFDTAYLDRALVLARSFARHCAGDLLLLGCMDEASARFLSALELPHCRVLAPGDFIREQLAAFRATRNVAEFSWTAKPFLMEHALTRHPESSMVVYLDADAMIFGPLSVALNAVEGYDCLLTPHNFSAAFAAFEGSVGRYNAGFAAFRNSERGRAALARWRVLCAGGVSATPSGEAYGDQKYLDELASRWGGNTLVLHKGINVAPWNIGNYRFTQAAGQVQVDGEPLLYFHFQGFQRLGRSLALLYKGSNAVPSPVRELVYRPYLAQLGEASAAVATVFGAARFSAGGLRARLRAAWWGRANLALMGVKR